MNIDELKIGDLVYCEHCCEKSVNRVGGVPCVTKYVGTKGGSYNYFFEIIACRKTGFIGCQCYNLHKLDAAYLI